MFAQPPSEIVTVTQAGGPVARSIREYGSGLLRPRQDGDRPRLHRRVRTALPQGRAHQPPHGGPGRHVPADLPLLRRRRGAARAGARVDAGADQGMGPGPGPPDRARDDAPDDGTDHVRRGARADGAAPGRRPPRLPGVGLTRGDRAPARRHARRGRGHLLAGRGRRARVLHGPHGLLRLRRVQGDRHARVG